MAMALYEPRLGYYSSFGEKIGRSGDYLTSPEVSPLFGEMVGRQLRQMWELLGEPAGFQVVEAGAGNGSLCRDIIRWSRRTAPDFHTSMAYLIVETSEALVWRQQALLKGGDLDSRVHWRDRLPDGIEGCILSNELLDAMPVHRMAVQDGTLQEVFVTWDGTAFREELRAPSLAEICGYFERLGLRPGEGCRAEVNLAALHWTKQAAGALRRGFLLTFDYGYEADEMFAHWRKDGTLMCFHRHNPGNDPYSRIGRQDMTSHVDFTSLRKAGEDAGLRTLGSVSQSEFLRNLGITDALDRPADGQTDLEDYYARRRALMELLDPAGLGRIKTLIQAKGVSAPAIIGLKGGIE